MWFRYKMDIFEFIINEAYMYSLSPNFPPQFFTYEHVFSFTNTLRSVIVFILASSGLQNNTEMSSEFEADIASW